MLPLTLVSAVLLLVPPKLAFGARSDDSNASSSEAGKPAPVLLDDMRSLFVWGDSYSSNTYMDRVRRTSNYTWDHYESHTSSGGDVWPRFLVDSANTGRPSSDNISLYDFAISGSSIEPILLDGPKPNPSLVNETDSFMRWFVNEEEGRALWTPETSLFVVASGINDVANDVMYDRDFPASVERLVDIYTAQVAQIYEAGARHFLFLTVPPFDRAPLGQSKSHETFVEWGHLWNMRLLEMVDSFGARFPAMEARVWDLSDSIHHILDSAPSLGFKEINSPCGAYAGMGFKPDANYSECRYPLSQFVWKDQAHPTWRVHQLLAADVERQLKGEAPKIHTRDHYRRGFAKVKKHRR